VKLLPANPNRRTITTVDLRTLPLKSSQVVLRLGVSTPIEYPIVWPTGPFDLVWLVASGASAVVSLRLIVTGHGLAIPALILFLDVIVIASIVRRWRRL